MSRKIDSIAVQSVLYGIYKSLHKIAGASSAAVMRQAAPSILDAMGHFGIDVTAVSNIEELQENLASILVEAGCCDAMDFKLEGDELTTSISNCAFFDLTMKLKEEGIPPFGCPFAALTIAIAERNLGKRARVTRLEPTPGGKKGDTTLVVSLS